MKAPIRYAAGYVLDFFRERVAGEDFRGESIGRVLLTAPMDGRMLAALGRLFPEAEFRLVGPTTGLWRVRRLRFDVACIGMSGGDTRTRLVSLLSGARHKLLVPSPDYCYRLGLGEGPATAQDTLEPQHDVQLVTYRLARYTDEEGVEHVGGLERLCQRTILAETAEEGSNVESVMLSRRIKFLRVQYSDGGQWTGTWDRSGLPAAVRIDLGIQPLDEGLDFEEYPHETNWRVVAVPAGLAGAGGPTR